MSELQHSDLESEQLPESSVMRNTQPRIEFYSKLTKIEALAETHLLQRVPLTMPDHAREVYVKVLPWAALVFLVLTLPLVFALLGLSAAVSPLTLVGGGVFALVRHATLIVISLLQLGLDAAAIPGLFKRTKKGWAFAFYLSLAWALGGVISFSPLSIVGSLLCMYFLFQTKYLYRN